MLTTVNYYEPSAGSSSLDHAFLSTINDCIKEHLSNPQFNANALAIHMEMSRSQLHKKMLQVIGQTPGKYLMQLRLSQAKALLNKSNDPIKHIAFQCGFSSYTTFWNAFHKYFDSSPGDQVRKKIIQEDTIDWHTLPDQDKIAALTRLLSSEKWSRVFMQLAVQQIIDHQCSVEKLAEAMCLSPFQLSNRVHGLVGIKPMAFCKYLRILYAAEMMQNESLTMTNIAYMAGFSDQSHMCRDFKAQLGMSPTVYRSLDQTCPYFSLLTELLSTSDDI